MTDLVRQARQRSEVRSSPEPAQGAVSSSPLPPLVLAAVSILSTQCPVPEWISTSLGRTAHARTARSSPGRAAARRKLRPNADGYLLRSAKASLVRPPARSRLPGPSPDAGSERRRRVPGVSFMRRACFSCCWVFTDTYVGWGMPICGFCGQM